MNTSSLLYGLIPLVVFAIIDSFSSSNKAIFMALVVAIIESIWTFYYFKTLDFVSLFSLGTLLIFAFISLRKKDSFFFKFQSSFMSLVFAIALFISHLLKKPIFWEMMQKYKMHLPSHMQGPVNSPLFKEYLSLTTFYLSFTLLAHAILTTYAALKMSKWWWLFIRGIGFYFFLFAAVILAQIDLRFS